MSAPKTLRTITFLVSFFCTMTGLMYVEGQTVGPVLSVRDVLLRGAIISVVAAPFFYIYFRRSGR